MPISSGNILRFASRAVLFGEREDFLSFLLNLPTTFALKTGRCLFIAT
jgi:hypothetical protein